MANIFSMMKQKLDDTKKELALDRAAYSQARKEAREIYRTEKAKEIKKNYKPATERLKDILKNKKKSMREKPIFLQSGEAVFLRPTQNIHEGLGRNIWEDKGNEKQKKRTIWDEL